MKSNIFQYEAVVKTRKYDILKDDYYPNFYTFYARSDEEAFWRVIYENFYSKKAETKDDYLDMFKYADEVKVFYEDALKNTINVKDSSLEDLTAYLDNESGTEPEDIIVFYISNVSKQKVIYKNSKYSLDDWLSFISSETPLKENISHNFKFEWDSESEIISRSVKFSSKNYSVNIKEEYKTKEQKPTDYKLVMDMYVEDMPKEGLAFPSRNIISTNLEENKDVVEILRNYFNNDFSKFLKEYKIYNENDYESILKDFENHVSRGF